MRRSKSGGNRIAAILFNMLLNLEWTIPAWLLLACHFIFGLSVWWFWAALGLWFLNIMFWTGFVGWAADCSTPSEPKENKNPYSVGAKPKDGK